MQGYSEDQLKGLDIDTIMKAYAQDFTKASMLVSQGEETEILLLPKNELSIEKLKILSQIPSTNESVDEKLKPAPAGFDEYQDLQRDATADSSRSSPQKGRVMPIAIIGMSCRFPGGATEIKKFWELVSEGRSTWSTIPKDRFNADAFYHPDADRTDAVSISKVFATMHPTSLTGTIDECERWPFLIRNRLHSIRCSFFQH